MSDYIGDLERWNNGTPGIGKKHWYSSFTPAALGRTLNKIRKSPILKEAIQFGDRVLQNPAVAKALGLPPEVVEGIHAGVGALWVEKQAAAGNVDAQRALSQAYAATASPAFQGGFMVPGMGPSPAEYASGSFGETPVPAMQGMFPPFGGMQVSTGCPCCGRPR
jgi:hypothetical protein